MPSLGLLGLTGLDRITGFAGQELKALVWGIWGTRV